MSTKINIVMLTLVSSRLAVFLLTMQSRSPAMALAVPDETRRFTPSSKLQNKILFDSNATNYDY